MKKVLIIAYDFPPTRTSGVYRPLKFARYLPEFGWQPVILTVSNYPTTTLDDSLLAQLPEGTPIYRAYSIEPKRWEKAIFAKLFGKAMPVPASPAGEALPSPPSNPEKSNTGGFSLKTLVKRGILSPISRFTHSYLYTPDEVVGWVPLAVKRGLQAIRHEGIDLIISTSPPETNHLVGLWLKRFSGKPWIADFRDPWTDNVIKQDKPPFRQRLERRWEQKVLERSDAVVHVGHRFAELSRQSFPSVAPEKHRVITNGFDESDFAGMDGEKIYAANRTAELNLLNVGTIYGVSGFPALLKAFEQVITSPNVSGKVRINFIGELTPDQKAALGREPIKSHVTLHGFKKHREALTAMMSADVLLLMPSGADQRTNDKIVPGKLYELIRIGRPVLMIGWEGESADIVRQSGTGRFVSADQPEQVAAAITDFVRRKADGELAVTPRRDFVRQYDRRHLTSNLAELFDSLSGITTSRQDTPVKVS